MSPGPTSIPMSRSSTSPRVCDYHIEDQVFRLTPGGMLVIPPNLMHYAEVVGDEVLVNFDIFTPKREEYVK